MRDAIHGQPLERRHRNARLGQARSNRFANSSLGVVILDGDDAAAGRADGRGTAAERPLIEASTAAPTT